MKNWLGLVGLLVTLALVGVLAKRQLAAVSADPATVRPTPAAGANGSQPQLVPGSPAQQVDQVKKDVETLIQPRAIPKDL